MSTPTTTLKARLLAYAEAAIDKLLAQKQPPETATLAEIEEVVLQARQQIEQALTSELVEESGQALLAVWPVCPKCGQRLKAKGKRPRRVVTVTGEVTVTREYYHCRACQRGFFPPG
jgi:uncharacterized protein with PIN domain